MDKKNLNLKVKQCNKKFYNNLQRNSYNENKSIFNLKRQNELSDLIYKCSLKSGNKNFLDVGTGTGNLSYIASTIFTQVFSTDLAENMLKQNNLVKPKLHWLCSDCDKLPFKKESFNVIGANALLHHLYSHKIFFKKVFEILKPDGIFFTEHDPNFFFVRFYYPFYRVMRILKNQTLETSADLSEYYHTHKPGLNPEILEKILKNTGFKKITIKYRHSDNRNLNFSKKIISKTTNAISHFFKNKSFFSHFSIIAEK